MQTAQFELHAEIEQRHWWFVARRQILAAVIEAVLPPSPHTTIIDVGCGTGANLALLAERYRCVGIDTSTDAIRLAKARFPRVEFVEGRAPDDLGAAIDQARLILLTDVLEHVADDLGMLRSLMEAAPEGTRFLITVPADMSLWSEHDRAFGHYRRYDFDGLSRLFCGLPLAPVFQSYFNSRLYPLVKAVRTINRLRGRSSGAEGTDFSLPSRPTNHLLTRCFAGERSRLVRLAQGEDAKPYRRGVSLMALLTRTADSTAQRERFELETAGI